MIDEHLGQLAGFVVDAGGAAHRCQKLEIINVALSPGCTRADLAFNCFSDTEMLRESFSKS